MTTLTDFIPKELVPSGVRKGLAGAIAVLALFALCMQLHSALTTGTTQRLPNTPKYTRDGNPGMFWSLVALYMVTIAGIVACLTAVVWPWIHGGSF
jgi:hypothetical protein